MGNSFSYLIQIKRKQYKVIYIQDESEHFYPLNWPETYSELLLNLKIHFNFTPKNNVIVADDVSEHDMYVTSQASFQALIPKHKEVPPGIDVFYIGIKLPVHVASDYKYNKQLL
jgi:hypothetical protein